MRVQTVRTFCGSFMLLAATTAFAQVDTKWKIHDPDRPVPPVVTPGTSSTQEAPGKAPSDAVVLFDGKDASRWHDGRGGPARWKVEDGALVSKDEFGDCQVHIEWAAPDPPRGSDQGRGNSGVLLMGRYEIQVLDTY